MLSISSSYAQVAYYSYDLVCPTKFLGLDDIEQHCIILFGEIVNGCRWITSISAHAYYTIVVIGEFYGKKL